MKAVRLGGVLDTVPVSDGREAVRKGRLWPLLLLLFFGLISATAADGVRVDCRQEHLKLNSGGHWRLNIGKRITLNRKQCELVAGGFRTFAGLDTVAVPPLRPARFSAPLSKAQLIR